MSILMTEAERTERTAFLDHFCTLWFEALNTRDPEAMVEITTPDLLWDETVYWPTPVRGHAELRQYLDRAWSAMPDVECLEIERFYSPNLDKAVVLWRQKGSGPPRHAPGKQFDFQGCDMFLGFRDGKLSHYQGAYEIVDMLRQLQMLPERRGLQGAEYLLSLGGAVSR